MNEPIDPGPNDGTGVDRAPSIALVIVCDAETHNSITIANVIAHGNGSLEIKPIHGIRSHLGDERVIGQQDRPGHKYFNRRADRAGIESDRFRWSFTCPRCKRAVTAREENLSRILELIIRHAVQTISLTALGARLRNS